MAAGCARAKTPCLELDTLVVKELQMMRTAAPYGTDIQHQILHEIVQLTQSHNYFAHVLAAYSHVICSDLYAQGTACHAICYVVLQVFPHHESQATLVKKRDQITPAAIARPPGCHQQPSDSGSLGACSQTLWQQWSCC